MRRRRGQGPSLHDKVWYRVGNLSLINRKRRGGETTELNLLFDPMEVQRFLESKWLNQSTDFTRMDILKIVRGLNKRGRIRLMLGLPYPPPSVDEAWRRAHHRVDEWLEYDLAPKPKTEVVVPDEKPPAPKVHEAWDEFWKYRTGPTSKLTKSVKINEDQWWRNHFKPYFGNKLTTEVAPQDLLDWVDEMSNKGLSKNYILIVWRAFKRFFNWLVERDKSDMFIGKQPYRTRDAVSPFTLVKNPERPALMERVTYTEEQLEELMRTCQRTDPTMFAVLVTAISTGMRIGEVLGLKWGNVSWGDGARPGYLTITGIIVPKEGYVERAKTKNGLRIVPMSKMLDDALRTWLERGPTIDEVKANLKSVAKLRKQKKAKPHGWWLKPRPIAKGVGDDHFIFVSSVNENPLRYGGVRERLLAIKKKAGIPHVKGSAWHEFRHAFVSWAMRRKVDVKLLQKSVGHSDMKTTMRYTHAVDEDREWINDLYSIGVNAESGESYAKEKQAKNPQMGDSKISSNGVQMGSSPSASSSDFSNLLKNMGFSGFEKIGVNGTERAQISAPASITTKIVTTFAWSVHGVSNTIKVERFFNQYPNSNS